VGFLKNEIDRLQGEMLSSDWDIALNASDRFVQIGGEDVIAILIQCLSSPKPSARNAAALALYELRDERAKDPLLLAIKNPKNSNSKGTLVTALVELDCSDLFIFFFRMALYDNFECQSKALIALKEKHFNVFDEEIALANEEIQKFQIQAKKPNDWEQLIVELSEIVDRFDR
jgi:HEAT repeat protein